MSKHEKLFKISMEEEVNKKTEDLEREITSDPALQDIQVTEEMELRMEERIRAYEAAKRNGKTTCTEEMGGTNADGRSAESGGKYNKVRHRRKGVFQKPKLWAALVAVFILVLSMGITSMSEKSFWKTWWDTMWGEDKLAFVDVEEMDVVESGDVDETTAYIQIDEALNTNVVCLYNLPEGMVFESYSIDEEQGLAKVFYMYNGEVVRYNIYLNGNNASYGAIEEDEVIEVFDVENTKQKVTVEAYKVPEVGVHRYIAYFEYGGVHYQLKGVMERPKIEEIIKNLKYL